MGAAGQLGAGILLGLAGAPLQLFAAHLLGMPLGRAPVWGLLGVTVVGLSIGLRPRSRRVTTGASAPATPPGGDWLPAEALLLALILLLVAASAWKGAFYPVAATDAHAYDGRARWIVAEKTLDLSVYGAIKATGATNISYPPVYPLDLALGYWAGSNQAKVVDSWIYGGLLLLFYGALRVRLPRLGALLGTLLLAATPEVYNHASLALINLPAMAYLAAAFLIGGVVREGDETHRRGLAPWCLAGILTAGAAGVRTDAAILTLAGAPVILFRADRPLRRAALLIAPAGGVTLLWQFYLKHRLGLLNSEPFRAGLLAEPGVVAWVGASLLNVLLFAPLFAYLFYTLAGALLLTGVGRLARARWAAGPMAPAARQLGLLLIWGLTLIAVFQALDPRFGGGLAEILRTSFKRVCFYLVPPAAAGLLLLPPVRNGLVAFDAWQRKSA